MNGPPTEVEGRAPHHQDRPSTNNNISSHHTTNTAESTSYCRALRLRRAAAQRLSGLDCGRSDPWWYQAPTAGYEDAAAHLLELGLAPAPHPAAMQQMRQSGGESRRTAQVIAKRWELVA